MHGASDSVPGFFTHPDGHGSFRCSTPALPLRFLTPSNRLKTAARAGQTTPQQPATRMAKNHKASETNLTPVFGQKKSPSGVKRWPRSGLANDFRHLAVGWQSGGVPMGAFCLMVKSFEL